MIHELARAHRPDDASVRPGVEVEGPVPRRLLHQLVRYCDGDVEVRELPVLGLAVHKTVDVRMIVEEHAHERSAAFSALNDDGPHGVPGLHEGDGARRLAARSPSDLGAELSLDRKSVV